MRRINLNLPEPGKFTILETGALVWLTLAMVAVAAVVLVLSVPLLATAKVAEFIGGRR